jgi:2'-hydroxyisoflavone reductase
MKILIIGGTRFVGRHLVTAARNRDHEVTLFNRGRHSSETPVETIHGDRNSDLDKLRGRRWDVVLDTCGILPRAVRAAAETLSGSLDRYIFISSISAYADLSAPDVDESAPLATLSDEQLQKANEIGSSPEASTASYGEMYGGLKALCEQAAEDVMPNRVLTIRPGLIVGPYDYTDRFTYWVVRTARGGEVLAPGRPDRYVQFIDVRDLAEFTVRLMERKETGVYNVIGPANVLTMNDVLHASREISHSDASFTWASEEFLLRENVAAWSEMPFWLPEEAAPRSRGLLFVNVDKAIAAGLNFRPLKETISDTLTWYQTARANEEMKAGILPEKELGLLRKWHERTQESYIGGEGS